MYHHESPGHQPHSNSTPTFKIKLSLHVHVSSDWLDIPFVDFPLVRNSPDDVIVDHCIADFWDVDVTRELT